MATPKVTIRPGTSDDCPAIAELITALGHYSAHKVFLDNVDEIRRDGFEGHPWHHTFVAEVQQEDGAKQVIGMALYYYGYSMFSGRSVQLESLFVKDGIRRQGLGKQLFKEVVKAAAAKGCKSLHVRTLETNTRARNLYRTQGAVDVTEDNKVHLISLNEPAFSQVANS